MLVQDNLGSIWIQFLITQRCILFNFLMENNFCILWIFFNFCIHLFLKKSCVLVCVCFNPTGENTSSYLSKNILTFRHHNILLGTTYRIIANALSSEPSCLAEIEESKARRILELSGSTSENVEKVMFIARMNLLFLCVICL